MLVSLRPQVELMQVLLRITGEAWDHRQSALVAAGKQRQLRLVIAAEGGLTQAFWKSVSGLLHDSAPWHLLKADERLGKWASLAFGMVSRAAGGVFLLLDCLHEKFPYKLWTLLGDDPEAAAAEISQISRSKKCLLDPFTRRFLLLFPEEKDLTSPQCLAFLAVLGIAARLDISRIECLHAWIRRVLRGKSQTNSAGISGISADFVLARARRHEDRPGTEKQPQGRKRQGEVVPSEDQPARRRPRGGAQRAFFSEQMKLGETNFETLHQQYKAILTERGAEYERLAYLGRLASQAGRFGARRVFGSSPPDCVPPIDVAAAFGVGGSGSTGASSSALAVRGLLTHDQLEKQILEASANRQRTVEAKQAEQRSDALAIQSWRDEKPAQFPGTAGRFQGSVGEGFLPRPCGSLEWRDLRPPLSAMVNHALGSAKPNLVAKLIGEWDAFHKTICLKDQKKLETPPVTLTACWKAGFCLCKQKLLQTFTTSWRKRLRSLFKKDAPLQPVMKVGAAILAVAPLEEAIEIFTSQWF